MEMYTPTSAIQSAIQTPAQIAAWIFPDSKGSNKQYGARVSGAIPGKSDYPHQMGVCWTIVVRRIHGVVGGYGWCGSVRRISHRLMYFGALEACMDCT
jgi:hypothetical protein